MSDLEKSSQYWDEIASIGKEAQEAVRDGEDLDTWVSDTVVGHEWVIYPRYHLDVLKHSNYDPEDAITEGLVDANRCIKSGGVSKLLEALAQVSIESDVRNWLSENPLEDEEEEEES